MILVFKLIWDSYSKLTYKFAIGRRKIIYYSSAKRLGVNVPIWDLLAF